MGSKPDEHEALYHWSGTLLRLFRSSSTDPERARLLDLAEEISKRAYELNPKKPYNLACIAALRGEPDRCHTLLLECHRHGTLPTRSHLETDLDLAAVRAEPWFAEVLALAKG